MKYEPHEYQVKATNFLFKNKHSMLFADMGTGKTAIVLALLKKLFYRQQISSVLVIAPLRVCQITWPIEIEKWDFSKRFSYTVLHGKNKETINDEYKIYIINYEGIAWLDEYLQKHPRFFDIVIFDEISKLKDPSTKRFKILKKLLPIFDRRIGLTGTPASNSYLDLFSQLYSIDKGKALGKFITHYKDKFFDQSWNGYSYTIKQGAAEKIDKLIAPLVFRIASDNPVSITYTDVNITLAPDIMKGYKKLEKESFLQFDNSVVVNGVNAAVLLNKLRQYVGGTIYTEEGVEIIHVAKINAVLSIEGPVIVAYAYKHELVRLMNRYPDSVDFSKGDQKDILERWNRGEIDRLLVHPASAGHGLNMQQGGHKLVWFTLTWSLEQYLQMNARIWRQGQEHPVEIIHLMVPNTVDIIVKSVLESKSSRQQALLDSMLAYRRRM